MASWNFPVLHGMERMGWGDLGVLPKERRSGAQRGLAKDCMLVVERQVQGTFAADCRVRAAAKVCANSIKMNLFVWFRELRAECPYRKQQKGMGAAPLALALIHTAACR